MCRGKEQGTRNKDCSPIKSPFGGRGIKIKVCGMREAENIIDLLRLPVDYVGFIFYEKSLRYVADPVIAPFENTNAKKVGVFVNATEADIRDKIDRHQLSVVQLHGQETWEICNEIKKMGVEVWKAFGIGGQFDFSALADYEKTVDCFIFDTKTTLHGGSGQTFDWNILKQYEGSTPYFISGGLSAENILSALDLGDSRLIGLDLNSKFEDSPGLKNIELIRQALNKINDEQISG